MRSTVHAFLLGLLLTGPATLMASDAAPTLVTWTALNCPTGVATIELSAYNSATGQAYPLALPGVSLPKETVAASWPNLLQASHVVTGTVRYQTGEVFSVGIQTVQGQGDALPPPVTQPDPPPTPPPTPTQTPNSTPTCTKVKQGQNADGSWYIEPGGWVMRTVNGVTDYALPGRGAEIGANADWMIFLGTDRQLVVQDSRDKLWYVWNRFLVNGAGGFQLHGPGAEPFCGTTTTPPQGPASTPTTDLKPVLDAITAQAAAQAKQTQELLTAIGALRPPVLEEPAVCKAAPLKMVSINWPTSAIGSRTGRWDSGTFQLVEAGFQWMPSLRFVAKDTRGCTLTIVK